ncbi:MAG: SCO family protein [Lishizhenia sp.]
MIKYLLVLLLFFSCTHKEKKNLSGLPYIGHHDIALIDEDGYQKGDTIFHTVEDFVYLNQDSVFLSSKDIKNTVWVVKFFFSHCRTICPPMTQQMAQLNDSLQDLADKITFLSFSIDPEKDTPSRLRKYKDRYGITASNWYFLTGDEAETHRLGTESFYVNAFADENAQGGFAHSANLILVDKEQHIRGLYDGTSNDGREQLEADIRKLISNEYTRKD